MVDDIIMKKQTKQNPALEALARQLGNSRIQVPKPQQPLSTGASSSDKVGESQSQPQDIQLSHKHENEVEALSVAVASTNHNLTDNTSPEILYPVVTNGFKRYIGQVVQVPIGMLRIEDNVRTQIIEDDDFDAFVATIQDRGVLQNLVAQLSILPDQSEDLLIISGQRRLVGCRRAGKPVVPCLIVDEMDQSTRIVLGLVENLMREDLPPIDIAFAYSKLIELGYTQEDLAQTFKCHRKTIQRYLSLTTWHQPAIDILKRHPRLFSTNFLFNGISRDILSDPDLLVLRLGKIVDQENGAAEGQSPSQNTKASKSFDDVVTGWNQTALQNLGVPIRMSGSRDNLRITIRCAGNEQVKRILEKLGISPDIALD